jgi:hypothetical protein
MREDWPPAILPGRERMRLRRLRCTAGVFLAAATLCSARRADAQRPDPLVRARTLYNQRQFEAAIAAADEGRLLPERADSADLIAARAYLERFRDSGEPGDLTSARERLRRLNPDHLRSPERAEFVVGLGETLYFDGFAGAAAEVFDSVLANTADLDPVSRERVLDWWASAVDTEAHPRPEIDRQTLYQRVRNRMRDELGVNVGSAAALYWLAAAARAQGDLLAAWEAAEAGWVRAPLANDRAAMLRQDLDRLVQVGIAPERARILAEPAETLLIQWEKFKEQWTAK